MRQELIQLENMLQTLKKVENILQQPQNISDSLIYEVLNAVEDINANVFGCRKLLTVSFDECIDNIVLFREQYERWMKVLFDELQYRKTLPTKIDYDFHVFFSHIAAVSEEELVEEAVACLKIIRKTHKTEYENIKRAYNAYRHFWGSLDLENGDVTLIKKRIHEMKSHKEDFYWLYNNLADYRSKKVLYGILRHWLTFDYAHKNSIKENNFEDYYDFDILNCDGEECLVDLGAYDGDSAQSFIENFGVYKRIYCYEMTTSSMEKLQKRLECFDNIVYRQVAVGNMNGSVHVADFEGDSSSNVVNPQGNKEIQRVRLDDDISEPVTFIKMDIEGSELEALKGAERHIREDKPKLAVCTYHNNHHIYEVPRLMREYNPQYKLYMRYNGVWNSLLVSEFVTFAIP